MYTYLFGSLISHLVGIYPEVRGCCVFFFKIHVVYSHGTFKRHKSIYSENSSSHFCHQLLSSNLLISFVGCAFGIDSKKSNPKLTKVFLLLFLLFTFPFSSMSHCWLILVYGASYIYKLLRFFFFFNIWLVVPAWFVEKTVFSTANCLCTFLKNQSTIIVWIYF